MQRLDAKMAPRIAALRASERLGETDMTLRVTNPRSEEQVMSDDDCKCGGWLDGIHSDNCPFKSPATAQPANTGYCPHGYAVAANCDECFAERKRQRDEAEKQPANTAGFQHDPEVRATYVKLSDQPVFETRELSTNPLVTVDLDSTGRAVGVEIIQPACPRCAELEDERKTGYWYSQFVQACHHRNAAQMERDDLKAKCEAMEKQNADLHKECATVTAQYCQQNVRLVAMEKALGDIRVIGKMAYDRQYQYDQVGKMLEIANAALAGGKK